MFFFCFFGTGDRLSLLLQARASDGLLVPHDDTDTAKKQVVVTSSTTATIVAREDQRDVIVEVGTLVGRQVLKY